MKVSDKEPTRRSVRVNGRHVGEMDESRTRAKRDETPPPPNLARETYVTDEEIELARRKSSASRPNIEELVYVDEVNDQLRPSSTGSRSNVVSTSYDDGHDDRYDHETDDDDSVRDTEENDNEFYNYETAMSGNDFDDEEEYNDAYDVDVDDQLVRARGARPDLVYISSWKSG